MKKYILIAFFLAILTGIGFSQSIVSGEYFFDSDPGVGNGTPVSFTSSDSVDVNFSIPVNSISIGYHILGIRAKDSNNIWSIYSMQAIYVSDTTTLLQVQEQTPLVYGEYFFDADPGVGNGVPVSFSSADSIDENFSILIDTLSAGYHNLSIRTIDQNLQWSTYKTQRIYVYDTGALNGLETQTNLITGEYFFDTDPGVGNGAPISFSLSDSVDVNFSILIDTLSSGYHNLSVRTLDQNMQWSNYMRQRIYVYDTNPLISTQTSSPIVQAEYFIDIDPGTNNGVPISISQADSVNINYSILIDTLDAGYHRLANRTKDAAGQWSHFKFKTFYVYDTSPLNQLETKTAIVAAEYFIGADPGVGNGTSISISQADSVEWTGDISTASLAEGSYTLTIRVQDLEGIWSIYNTQEFSTHICTLPVAEFSITSGCPGDTVFFTDLSTDVTAGSLYDWDFNSDGTIDDTTVGNTFWLYQPGDLTIPSLTVTHNFACSDTYSETVANPELNLGNDTIISNTDILLLDAGTGFLSYSWSDASSMQSNSIDGSQLAVGFHTYYVTTTYGSGCELTDSITIEVEQSTTLPITVSVLSNDILCYGLQTGGIEIFPSGGTLPYQYSWSNGELTNNNYGLSAGWYYFTVTDASLQSFSDSIEISQPDELTINVSTTNLTCSSCSDGEISLSVNGGTSPYSYVWTPVSVITSVIIGLSSGTYYTTVTDSNGCIESTSAEITDLTGEALTISPINATAYDTITITFNPTFACFQSGSLIGADSVALHSGVTFSDNTNWNSVIEFNGIGNDGSTTTLYANGDGTYSKTFVPYEYYGFTYGSEVIAINTVINNGIDWSLDGRDFDGSNCIDFYIPLSFTNIELNAIIDTLLCIGGNNASININPTGGVGPYTFNWSNSETTEDIYNLEEGDYSVTVFDNSGNIKVSTYNIDEPVNGLSLSSVIYSSNFDYLTTGLGLVEQEGTDWYTWDTLQIQDADIVPSPNLASGNSFLIEANDDVVFVTPDYTTGRYEISFSMYIDSGHNAYFNLMQNYDDINNIWGFEAFFNPDGTISVSTHQFGLLGETFNHNEFIDILISIDLDNDFATFYINGIEAISWIWSIGTNNNNGIQKFKAIDFYGDPDNSGTTSLYYIDDFKIVKESASISPITCDSSNFGSIDISIINGNQPYLFNWDNGLTSEDLNFLEGGNYSLTVTDVNGCTSNKTFDIPSFAFIDIISDIYTLPGNEQAIYIYPLSDYPPFEFQWSNGSTNSYIEYVPLDNYSVTVTDSLGCVYSESFNLASSNPHALSFDGIDDYVAINATPELSLTDSFTISTWFNPTDWGPLDSLGLGYGYILQKGAILLMIHDTGYAAYNPNSLVVWMQTDSGTVIMHSEPYTVSLSEWHHVAFTYQNSEPHLYVNGVESQLSFLDGNLPGGQLLDNSNTNLLIGNRGDFLRPWDGLIDETKIWQKVLSQSEIYNQLCGVSDYSDLVAYWDFDHEGNQTVLSEASTYTNNGVLTNFNFADANSGWVSKECSEIPYIEHTLTHNLCHGDSLGEVSLAISGGISPYSVLWSNGESSLNLTELTTGSYCVTITDANSASINSCFEIIQPSDALTTTGTIYPVSGTGISDGAIQVSTSGGTLPYNYDWGNSLSSDSISALSAGMYTLVTTDLNNCIALDTFYVTEPMPILITLFAEDISCFGFSDGEIYAQVSGGIPPYSYAWSNGGNTSTISGLMANSYNLTVTDANGIISYSSETISESSQLLANSSATDVYCYNTSTGSVELFTNGGTTPYSYTWSNGESSSSIYGLSAGAYFNTITDANGCEISDFYIIQQPDTVSIVGNISPLFCNNDNSGMIELDFYGGIAPFIALWSTGSSQHELTNLSAGTYCVTVEDANGCVVNECYELTEPDILTITGIETDILCYGESTGDIDITINGGTLPFTYAWSNGSTSQDMSSLFANTYTVTVEDSNGCEEIANITVSEPTELTLISQVSDESSAGASDGSIDISVSGANPPYSFQWSNSVTIEDLSNITAGNYSVTVLDQNGCELTQSFIVASGGPVSSLPSWTFTNTGTSHTVLIQNSSPITIDGVQISIGDYLGVFYDSLGTLACGGFEVWNGSNLALTVWGDDSQTTDPDGFLSNETFIWKIWRASDQTEFTANAVYMQAPVMPNTDFYVTNGMSGLISLTATTVEYQYITLPQGWSYFSSYIDAFEPNIDSLCAPIVSDIIISKDGYGNTYWPQWSINLIGDIIIGDGYQIKLATTQTMVVEGISVVPEQTPFTIVQGWSILGYLRQTPAPIDQILSPYVSEIIIVKNSDGQTFWPQWSINMIGNMNPGEGYLIKMNSLQTITYPANSESFSKAGINYQKPAIYKTEINSGKNMTLGIPTDSWDIVPQDGCEVGVFTNSGILVGSGVFKDENMAITIWGDDEQTTELDGISENMQFVLKLWDNNSESEIKVSFWTEGDNKYSDNKISVVGNITLEESMSFNLYQNIPNPFKDETEIKFSVPFDSHIQIEVLNILGETIDILVDKEFSKGEHSIKYNSKSLNEGTYFYRLRTETFTATKKMLVIKH